MPDLAGKVAIVMGASTPGGMGEAIARRLAKEGAVVVVSGRTAPPLQLLAEQIGGSAYPADIMDSTQSAALVTHAMTQHGKLDIAVNAAGLAPRVPFEQFTEEHLMLMARMHFIGPAMFIKHAAEGMVEDGAIVNISSLSAYDPVSGIVGYAASKRAGDRVVQGAALEYRRKRLRINGVAPSLVPTELSRQGIRNYGMDAEAFERDYVQLTPLGRISRPEDIAAMCYMLVRDEFFETGQIFHYSGGNWLMGQPRYLA